MIGDPTFILATVRTKLFTKTPEATKVRAEKCSTMRRFPTGTIIIAAELLPGTVMLR
jgi:hypothetical protein